MRFFGRCQMEEGGIIPLGIHWGVIFNPHTLEIVERFFSIRFCTDDWLWGYCFYRDEWRWQRANFIFMCARAEYDFPPSARLYEGYRSYIGVGWW